MAIQNGEHMTINISKSAVFILPLLLVACASQPQQPETKPVEEVQVNTSEKVSISSTPEPEVEAAKVNETATAPQAVLTLIERSQQQLRDNDFKGAGKSLERAIRITPRYPDSYYYLAKVRYLEGQYAQARSLAKKTLSLGAQDSLLENVLVLLGDIHESEAK